MASTSFGFRYPSSVSPGKAIYALGSGTANDPYVGEIKLSGSGYYFFYGTYMRATGEDGVFYEADLHQPNLDYWFNLLDSDRETVWQGYSAGIEGSIKTYRFPLSPFYSEVSIAPSEDIIKLKVICEGSQAGGWIFATVLSATRPVTAPHLVEGFTVIPVGSIRVNIEDDLGGWKILHEDTYRASGDIVSGLGVGPHLITFDDVNGKTSPADQFVTVSSNTTSVVSVSYV